MTIGIGAAGSNAGLAVWDALHHVEKVCRGSIGGFATFVALSEGDLYRYATQRGGSQTLFTDTEAVLDEPPGNVRSASVAGVISSGPDRPTPLAQFLPAEADSGLVTGHRLPNEPDETGNPLNELVCEMLAEGSAPETAVDRIVSDNPGADAGFIAVSTDHELGMGNTNTVQDRPDIAAARRDTTDATVGVLANSIWPVEIATDLAAEVAINTMTDGSKPKDSITVATGTTVVHGKHNYVNVDGENNALRITTTNPRLVTGNCVGAVPYLGSTVYRDDTPIGSVDQEVNTQLTDGEIVSLSGQSVVELEIIPEPTDSVKTGTESSRGAQ